MEENTNYAKPTQRDYSMSLKLQMVVILKKETLSITQVRQQYGIQSYTTVLNW
jgi:transposase